MISTIMPEELAKIQDKAEQDASKEKVQLVDVRRPDEFLEARARGAINIPLDEVSSERLAREGLDTQSPVYIICRSGARSMKACELLDAEGLPQLINVEGGTLQWLDSGLPTG